MEKAYYYLIASLPMLSFAVKAPLSYKEFLEDCQRILPSEDFDFIKVATLESQLQTDKKNETLILWKNFQNKFCNEKARFRAMQNKQDFFKYLRGDVSPEPRLAEAMGQAWRSPDPLSAEKSLDKLRWQYLDDLSFGHSFDLDFLIIYGLKLQILDRYRDIESSKGEKSFEEFSQTALTVAQK